MIKKTISLLIVVLTLTNCSLVPLPPEARDVLDTVKSNLRNDSSEGFSLSELQDEKIRNYVQSVAKKLSRLANLNTQVTVLETDSVQAQSAFDNPEILITRGMLNSISNEAELAAVISHEIGHKALKHKSTPKNSELIDSILSKGTEKISNNGDLSSEINSYRRDLMWALWSQSQEQEADEYAVKLSVRAGYGPTALPDLLGRLAKISTGSSLQRLMTLKNSHKALSSRASHLRKFISLAKLNSQGTTGEQQYREALRSLTSNPESKIDQKSLNEITSIKTEIQNLSRHHKGLSISRFIEIMNEISVLAKKNNIDITKLVSARTKNLEKQNNHNGFMEEDIRAPSPFWNYGTPLLSNEIKTVISDLTRVGVGFVPILNNVAALYEVLSGKDFISGKEIGLGGRALSALGLAMSVGTEWRQVTAGIESTLASEGAQLSRGEIESVQKSIHIADEVREESNLYGRSKLGEEFNHHLEKGPLLDKDAQNFMGSKYREVFPKAGEKLYRVGNSEGNWWSRVKPTSQVRSMSENAILPEWNDFSHASEITIPKGFDKPVYEGLSSSLGGKITENGGYASNFFHGGGNQVYIEDDVIKNLIKKGSVIGGRL